MEHAFNTNIAAQYDVNIALLIQHFKHWTLNNLANKRHIHEGLCWTYNTVQAFCEIFHYWTRHQIEHLLKKAEAQELIVSGNHNQNKYDRTKWYALTPKVYHFYEELQVDAFIERLYSSISPDSEMHKCLILPISENSEMEFGYFRNLFRKIPKPIPDTDPDTDPNTKKEKDKKEKDVSDETPHIDYNSSHEQNNENQKSDYFLCAADGTTNTSQVGDSKPNSVRSDYFDNQRKTCTNRKSKQQLGLKELLNDNPFNIPEQMLSDWIENRKKKRAPITITAWNKILKELIHCKAQHTDPIEAFETMVASGWNSLKAKYFESPKQNSTSQWDVDSVMRA